MQTWTADSIGSVFTNTHTCLHSSALVKIHEGHGVCRRVCDLYMNCVDVSLSTCTSTAEVAAGNALQTHNYILASATVGCIVDTLVINLKLYLFCLFFISFLSWRKPCSQSQLHAVAALKQSHSKWGILTKERHERGPISLLTTDFIPCVKGSPVSLLHDLKASHR